MPASDSLLASTKIMKPHRAISVATNGARPNRHGRQNFCDFLSGEMGPKSAG